jgi:predicted deacylase
MPPANPPLFAPAELAARFESAGRAAGFRTERFGEISLPPAEASAQSGLPAVGSAKEGCPLVALTKRTPGPRPRIYFSAGIHGDEPAPPLALLECLEAGVFDARANWLLCPLLNPAGFLRGARENADRVDLNRDYRHLVAAETRAHVTWLQRQPNFDYAICLHEDWESAGFYLYELNSGGRPTLADAILAAVAKICPIDTATIIDGRAIDQPGIIRPAADPLLRELWPEAIYLRAHHTALNYTLETPSSFPIAQRIAALRAAIETVIAGV